MPEVSIVPKFESNGDGSDSQNVFAHGIAARDLRRARHSCSALLSSPSGSASRHNLGLYCGGGRGLTDGNLWRRVKSMHRATG